MAEFVVRPANRASAVQWLFMWVRMLGYSPDTPCIHKNIEPRRHSLKRSVSSIRCSRRGLEPARMAFWGSRSMSVSADWCECFWLPWHPRPAVSTDCHQRHDIFDQICATRPRPTEMWRYLQENWNALDHNGIHGFWFKRFPSIPKILARQLPKCLRRIL